MVVRAEVVISVFFMVFGFLFLFLFLILFRRNWLFVVVVVVDDEDGDDLLDCELTSPHIDLLRLVLFSVVLVLLVSSSRCRSCRRSKPIFQLQV